MECDLYYSISLLTLKQNLYGVKLEATSNPIPLLDDVKNSFFSIFLFINFFFWKGDALTISDADYEFHALLFPLLLALVLLKETWTQKYLQTISLVQLII